MKKETSKKLSASLLASAIILNTVLSINADDGSNYHSAGESGVQGSFTSAPLISFNTIGSSGVDLKEGNFENWVDRVKLPDYAVDMYNTISDETFWTNADNFSDSNSSSTYVTAEYGNGTSDKFNGLLVLESEPQNEDYSDDVKNGIRTALRAAFDAFDRDNPDVFWLTGETNFKSLVTYVKNGDTTTYTMKTYLVLKDYVTGWDMRREAYRDTSALGRAISDMDDAVETIVESANGTDYEKIKYFNKYLTESNEYNTVVSGNGETPEGTAEAYCAIFGGTDANGPVCEGYSRAFKVLCDEAGIPCVLTDGTADNGPHMWNYAKVGDSWYAVDVTWNDPTGGESGAVSGNENEDYLLVGSETVVDSEVFGDTHIVSNTVSLSGISFTNGPELSAAAYVPTEIEREYEAVIGDRKFATLEEAAAAASYDETVKLLDNISRDTNITIGASGTIDLDGKTINMNGNTLTADKSFTLTDSAGTGAVNGNIIFSYGGTAEKVVLGDVFVSGGSLTMTDSSANSLSVVNGTASVSDSSFKGVSSPTDIAALLADGQMYFVDGTVITADKLDTPSLSGDITVAAGKATGIIENKDYVLSYIYGSDIPAPAKDNFTYYGEEPVFSWNTADNSVPAEAGTYVLTVTSAATDRVDSATRNFTVEIEEYTSDAKATLRGEKGNNDWIVKNAEIVAPEGFAISTEYDGVYSDSIPVTEDGKKSVTYYLKEAATGYIVPAQIIDVRVDLNAPEFASSASILKLTASEASISVIATDGNGSGVSMYTAKFGSTELYSQNGLFNLIDLIPGTEYTLDVTVTDIAGNVATGTVKFTTESGTPSEINPPSLTGVYGTSVRNMTISGGSVKFGTENVDGVWTITDANASDIPEVGTKNTYKLTFTPSTSAYKPVEASVTPVVVPLGIENAVISGVQDSYDYTGDVIKPVVVVTLGGKTLADSDYVVEYGVNTNCGTDAGKVTVKGKGNYAGTAVTTFDILKIDTIITAVTRDIEKNFGDGSFNLGVITNNSETTLNYSVTNSDVVEVNEKGIVKIKGAGVTIVSVSQNETTNHKANISGVNIFITVNQGKAPVVDNVTVKFVHSMRNTGEVDMAEIMRAACSDCGPMTFSAYENSALLSGVYIYEDGTLTFDVDKGDIGTKGTVVVTVYSQNYEAATIRVIAELTDKFPTKVKGTVAAANNITYGQPLSDILFKDATFVTDEGDTVKGTLAWEKPETIPSVSDKSAVWVFTPENTDRYEPCTGTATIAVKKAVPTVTTPIIESMVYDASRKLSDVAINGADGKATVNGAEAAVPGIWSWSKPATVPNCKTAEYAAVFTPNDSVNFEDVDVKIIITVARAQAEITKMPTATAITYGQKVSDSTLKNGSANTAGKFSWAYGDTVYDAGTYEEDVVFTPSDTVNYTEASAKVSLTVNKAKNAPDMPSSKISASYDITTVGGVELPDYWNWDYADSQKGLAVGSSTTAIAVYNGLDKGNYLNESVVVTITRSKCSHKNTKTINEKKATCLEKGYSGDTYCSDCDTVTVKGKDLAITDHSGGKATCSALAVCSSCKKTYGTYDKEKHSGTKVIRNAVAPTATSAGYTGDICCSACGTVFEKGSIIPVLGSTSVTTAATTSSPVWNVVTTTTKAVTTTKATTTKATTTTKTTTKKTTTTTAPDDYEGDDSKYDEDAPYIYDNDEKYGWDDIVKEVNSAKSGSTIEVDMNYTTSLPAKALKALKGKNVELVLHMDDYFSWVINGMNIESAKDLNMEIVEGEDDIPVSIVDKVTGEAYSTTITLTHNGEFGFTTVLRYDAGEPGYYANLYYYNPTKKAATFVTSDKIDSEGVAELTFTHASEYIIVIDKKNHSGRSDVEYTDDDDGDYDDYEGSEDVTIDDGDNGDDLFDNGNDYYTGGDKNPSTGLGFGHILVGILGVSAFAVRPKNEKRKRKTL